MISSMFTPLFFVGTRLCALALAIAAAWSAEAIRDKTLVAWVALADLDQRAGSALTIEDGQSHFDGIVFGELTPHKWMAGSDTFNRTQRNQGDWPVETAGPETFVQMAIVYRGREVTVFRNAQLYCRYTMSNPPQAFGPAALVVFGRRHIDATDKENSFAGRIKDARIYDRPLAADDLAGLVPGKADGEHKPWAWWSFGDEGLREKTGRFTEVRWIGPVRLEHGSLVLGGRGSFGIRCVPRTGPDCMKTSRSARIRKCTILRFRRSGSCFDTITQ